MMLFFQKQIFLLLLIVTSVARAQDPGTQKYTREKTSTETTVNDEVVRKVADSRMPFESGVVIRVVAEGLPTTIFTVQDFQAIIYPISEYPIYEKPQNVLWLETHWLPVSPGIDAFTNNHHMEDSELAYDNRYQRLESLIYRNLKNFIENHTSSTRIAIAPFYHPIYFSNPEILAFHIMSAVSEAIRTSPERTFHITILTSDYPEVQAAFENEILYRTEIAKNTPGSEKYRKVSFYIEKTPDLDAERSYFLQLWDEYVKNKKVTYYDVMEAIYGNGEPFGKNEVKIAPPRMIQSVREFIEKYYHHGIPPTHAEVEIVVRTRLKNVFASPTDVEQHTQKIMDYLKDRQMGDCSKLDIYKTFLDPQTPSKRLNEAVGRIAKR